MEQARARRRRCCEENAKTKPRLRKEAINPWSGRFKFGYVAFCQLLRVFSNQNVSLYDKSATNRTNIVRKPERRLKHCTMSLPALTLADAQHIEPEGRALLDHLVSNQHLHGEAVLAAIDV